MDSLREVATAIVDEALLQNWRFWLTIGGCNIISAAAGAFAAAYLQKRGETAAIQTDLAKILAQLERTTAVATETRTAIERVDWLEREWRSVRRQKLEQLLEAVYDLETWLEQLRDRWLHNDQVAPQPRALEHLSELSSCRCSTSQSFTTSQPALGCPI